tara:strand:+ start:37461 stop:40292 length:2832 start_codon:yes stop_codon:yes gene_type:complete
MLNISKGIYDTNLPTVLIKEIDILPSEQQEEQIREFNIVVRVLVQTTSPTYNTTFNLNVSAITSENEESVLSIGDMVKKYVYRKSDLIKNIHINNLSKEGSRTYFNSKEDSTIFSKVVDVPIVIKSTIPLQHLSILCFTSEIITDQQLYLGTNFNISRYLVERVKTAGTINRTSVIYKLLETVEGFGTEGDVWTGPVHRHSQTGLMAGSTHSDKRHPRLEEFEVPNQKIKDYRTSVVNSLISSKLRKSAPLREYFNNVSYSRTKNGSVRVCADFHFLRYVRSNAALSYLFDNNTALLSVVDILDIKVYRHEIESTSFGNYLTPIRPVGEQTISSRAPRRLVGTLSDGSVKVIRANASDNGVNIMPLLIVDNQMQDEIEGYYHYDIEIEINDNSLKIVSEMISDLQDKITIAQSYNLKFNNYGKKGFDVQQNTIAREAELAADKSWKSSLEAYIAILQFVFGARVGPIPVGLIAQNMLTFASPYSASQKSLSEFNKILNDFVEVMIHKTSNKSTGKIQKSQNFNSSIAGSEPLVRKLKVVSDIKKNYLNSLSNKAGFDYLGNDVQQSDSGLSRIGFDQFKNRIISEEAKYDVALTNNIEINKFGFISPSEVKTNTTSFKVQKENSLNKSLDLLQANEVVSTKSKNFKANSNLKDSQSDAIQSLLGVSGIMFAPGTIPLKSIYNQKPSDKGSGRADSSDYFSSTSVFVKDNKSATAAASGSLESKIKQMSRRRSDYIDNNLIQFAIQQKATDFKNVKPVNEEAIFGSLAYEQLTKSPENFDSLNVLEKNLNFNSVVKIEYSVGNGDSWAPMTAQNFDTLRNSNNPVLCRLTEPNNVLNVPNKFKLEKYDEMFILGDQDPRTTTGNISSDRVMKTINKNVTKLFNESLNIKGASEAVMSEYLSSRPAAPLTTSEPTESSRQRSETATVAPRRTTSPAPGGSGGGGY